MNKIVKTKPTYRLFLLGMAQLMGALAIYRLGVLTIKESWINVVCTIASLGLVVWGGYLIRAFFKFFKLKDRKLVFGDSKFMYYGTELDYRDVTDFELKVTDSDMSLKLHLAYLDEPIEIISAFMSLKEFHEIVKIFIERKAQ